MKNTLIKTLGACASTFLAGQVGAQITEDFDGPATISNFGVSATLGNDGGTGDGPAYTFGSWVFSQGNGGIDQPGAGSEDGTTGNPVSSIGVSRSQDISGTNARANWVVFESTNFTDGVEYQVSFDVIGDPDGNANVGRYWMAELSGFDGSGDNWIQGDGTHDGWGGGAKPWSAIGAASVNFIKDSIDNGIIIPEASQAGTTNISTSFVYDATNSPDIGFAVGTFNNVFAIDNFSVIPEPSSFALLAGLGSLGLIMLRRRR